MDIDQIKLKVPIEVLAKQIGLPISYDSGRYAKCVCPFHGDHDPSFTIDKVGQTARCYGSGCVAGHKMDHIKLIRLVEHLDDEEAVDRLYEIAGERRPMNQLADFMRVVFERLHKNIDMDAPKYFFDGKGITRDALSEMWIGYSPNYDWFKTAIADIPPESAAQLEFFKTHLWNNTIVYPRHDGMGRLAGFQVRPLGGGSQKYYHAAGDFPLKPTRVYGLHKVRGSQIILVEGPNDALALKSHGIKNVGALLGSNAADIESYLSDRGFTDIIFISDGDEAGHSAIVKAPPLIRVAQIPFKDMDPDEYLIKHGPIAFSQLVASAPHAYLLKIRARLMTIPPDITGRMQLAKSIAMDISKGLPGIVIRKVTTELAAALDVPQEDVELLFEMVDFDTSDIEGRIVSHIVHAGPLTDAIKEKVQVHMVGDPYYRKQYAELIKGFSLTDVPNTGLHLTANDIERYIDICRRRHVKKLLQRSEAKLSDLSEPLDSLVSILSSKVYDLSYDELRAMNSQQQMSLGTQYIIDRHNNQDTLPGLSFGPLFPLTDETLMGLKPGEIQVLAGTTGVGKSNLALDWAMSMAYGRDIPVLWVSLEMNEVTMALRIRSKLTGISNKRMFQGAIDDDELVKVGLQGIKYSGKPLHIVTSGGMTVSQFVALVRKYKATKGIQAVFLDYMQLLNAEGKGADNLYEKGAQIIKGIKGGITQDMGIPVLAIAQLSKVAKKASLQTAEHMSESYHISQTCDVLMTIRRRDATEIENDKKLQRDWGNAILNIDKNRSGQDKVLRGLMFDPVSLDFAEVECLHLRAQRWT